MLSYTIKRTCYGLLACLLLFVWSCAPKQPLPQPRRVIDPSTVYGAQTTPRWDIGAVRYEHLGQGMDYSEAGLEPVFLVMRNKSLQQPLIRVEEARAIGVDGEYLPYSLEEATRLVYASESFQYTASHTARNAGIGALLGAGLGALIGTVGGGDNIWKGAAIGAGVGALAGGAGGMATSDEASLKKTIRQELAQYAWTDDPIPPDYTKVGYLYMPADRGIESVKVVLRVGEQVLTYRLPLSGTVAATPASVQSPPPAPRAPQSPPPAPRDHHEPQRMPQRGPDGPAPHPQGEPELPPLPQ